MGFLDGLSGSDALRRARETIEGVNVPGSSDLQLRLEELVQAGLIEPEQVEAYLMGPSAYEEISIDPRLRGVQTDAMDRFREIGESGGMDALGRAGMEDALETMRTENRGQQGAIMAQARARGQGGSGLEYTARLQGQQGAASRASRAAIDVAAESQRRRDNALTQGASLATSTRNQDYQQQQDLARAREANATYNANAINATRGMNAQSRTIANAANLGERQRVSDSNVGLRNEENRQRAQLPITLYGLQRGAAGDSADARARESEADQARNNSYMGLAGSLAMAYALSDEEEKQGFEKLDSREALRDLSSSTWSYEDDPSGERHAGPMAQEFERGPMASAVHDTPEGKMVDYGSMGFESGEQGGMVMSLLADLNKRLEQLEGGSARG